jgi:nucleotide-binding universal stress UspA family protein
MKRRHVLPLPLAGGAMDHNGIVLFAYDGSDEAKAAIRASPRAQSGEPIWRSIVDAVAACNAGIVVLESHRRNGLGRALLGSVAADVAHHTDRPVLIVPSP